MEKWNFYIIGACFSFINYWCSLQTHPQLTELVAFFSFFLLQFDSSRHACSSPLLEKLYSQSSPPDRQRVTKTPVAKKSCKIGRKKSRFELQYYFICQYRRLTVLLDCFSCFFLFTHWRWRMPAAYNTHWRVRQTKIIHFQIKHNYSVPTHQWEHFIYSLHSDNDSYCVTSGISKSLCRCCVQPINLFQNGTESVTEDLGYYVQYLLEWKHAILLSAEEEVDETQGRSAGLWVRHSWASDCSPLWFLILLVDTTPLIPTIKIDINPQIIHLIILNVLWMWVQRLNDYCLLFKKIVYVAVGKNVSSFSKSNEFKITNLNKAYLHI